MRVEKQIRNWVILGESGCGKTEVSLYLAKAKRKEGQKRVTLIDMDQTKGMFRSRDFADALQKEGINVVSGAHFMDMPVIPHGVEKLLLDKDVINILDVGGNEAGAVSLGQFSELINMDATKILYLLNPYRNFSRTTGDIKMLMESIQNIGQVKQVAVFCNPNVGAGTTEEDVLEGCKRMEGLLAPLGLEPEGLVIPCWVDGRAFSQLGVPIWAITPCIKYP